MIKRPGMMMDLQYVAATCAYTPSAACLSIDLFGQKDKEEERVGGKEDYKG